MQEQKRESKNKRRMGTARSVKRETNIIRLYRNYKRQEERYYHNQRLAFFNKHNKAYVALSSIKEKWLEDLQEYLEHDIEIKNSTAKGYMGVIRRALKKAVRDRLIPRDPSIGVRTIKTQEIDKIYLEHIEIQRLANTPINGELGAEIKKAFLFACFTGLRISDIKSLQWGDITWETLHIAKRQEKTECKVFVPLHETAWKIINDSKIHNYKELVFPQLTKT